MAGEAKDPNGNPTITTFLSQYNFLLFSKQFSLYSQRSAALTPQTSFPLQRSKYREPLITVVPPQFDTFTTQFLHLRLGEGRSGDIKTESQRTITLVAKHYLLKMIIIKKKNQREEGRKGSIWGYGGGEGDQNMLYEALKELMKLYTYIFNVVTTG